MARDVGSGEIAGESLIREANSEVASRLFEFFEKGRGLVLFTRNIIPAQDQSFFNSTSRKYQIPSKIFQSFLGWVISTCRVPAGRGYMRI